MTNSASSNKNLVGKQLGDYKLTEALAVGGMSQVYVGEDVKIGRKAAVKVLTQELLEKDSNLTERFQREARAVGALEHDNIITIYQYGEQDDIYFLAMRLVIGHDLADELNRLQRQGKLMSVDRMINLLSQVASALDYAHKAGIIHRDIKPSNILIDKSDKAILTDFGLVLRQKVDQTLGTAFGTPRYISPEQALASEAALPQSDIYSLAVIVYEIITGQTVYKADTAMGFALSHISEPPPPPRSVNPEIPRSVEREVLKALDKKPEHRHETATEFIEALKEGYRDTLSRKRPIDLGDQIDTATPVFTSRPNVKALVKEKQENEAKDDIKQDKNLLLENTLSPETRIKEDTMHGRRRSLLSVLLGAIVITIVAVGGLVFSQNNGASVISPDSPLPTRTAQTTSVAVAGGATDEAEVTPTTGEIVAIENGVPITLFYNFDMLALKNTGDTAIELGELAITAENIASDFNGRAIPGSTLESDSCLVIRFQDRRVDIPEDWDCATADIETTLGTNAIFWRSNAGDTFVISVNGQAIANCDSVARGRDGECEFNYPSAENEN
ncbi:MAG: serine/threonine-protein kinase [Aggregatilineales bacterium]